MFNRHQNNGAGIAIEKKIFNKTTFSDTTELYLYPGRDAVSFNDSICVLHSCSIRSNDCPAQTLVQYLHHITVQTDTSYHSEYW